MTEKRMGSVIFTSFLIVKYVYNFLIFKDRAHIIEKKTVLFSTVEKSLDLHINYLYSPPKHDNTSATPKKEKKKNMTAHLMFSCGSL